MPIDIATLAKPTILGPELLAMDDGTEMPKAATVGDLRANYHFHLTIFEQGGVYKAINNVTGFLDYTANDLHTVVIAAANANPGRTTPVRITG